MRASFEAAGGRTRLGARVERVLVADGKAIGVVLDDSTTLRAPTIVAAVDPQRVFVDWIDGTPPAAKRLVERWRSRPVSDGYESKVDGVVRGTPRWRGADDLSAVVGGADLLGPTTLISPSPDDVAEAHRMRERGEVHPRPSLMVNLPSALDETMRPSADEHVLSVEVLFTPYELRGGWPDSGEPARWLEVLDGFMEPGTLQVDRWRAMTPDRYEAEFSMHRGHTPAYGEAPLVAFLGRRRELTRYATPIDGLFLSGAGTFPGAGVFGASGRNAADAVLNPDGLHGRLMSDQNRPHSELGRPATWSVLV
ncbi:MAG: hypothetical protein R2697_16265 [Ilumatobacteraceae bacterium]